MELKLIETVLEEELDLSDEPGQIIAETEELVKELLLKAETKAKKTIENANDKAQQLIAKATLESENIKNDAYQEGYDKGFAVAQQEVEKAKQKTLRKANSVLEEAEKKKRDYLLEVKPQIVDLAINIAEKLIFQQLTLQTDAIQEVVNELIKKASPDTNDVIVIQVAPESMPVLTEALEANKLSWPAEKVKLETSHSLTIGSCIILTSNGTYQLKIEEAITKIKELILGAEIYE